MVRRPVLGIEEVDLENTELVRAPSLTKQCPNLPVLPLHEREDVFWRVHGECTGPEHSDGRINRPLLDLPPTHGGAGHTNERNRAAGRSGEEIPTYRNQLPPVKAS